MTKKGGKIEEKREEGRLSPKTRHSQKTFSSHFSITLQNNSPKEGRHFHPPKDIFHTPSKKRSNLEANFKKTLQNNSEGLKEHNNKILLYFRICADATILPPWWGGQSASESKSKTTPSSPKCQNGHQKNASYSGKWFSSTQILQAKGGGRNRTGVETGLYYHREPLPPR